jgi:membrane protein YdbS with pleckstrin-like domain
MKKHRIMSHSEYKYLTVRSWPAAILIVVGVIATVVIAALTTGGDTGSTPSWYAWCATIVVPFFMTLAVSAWYSTHPRYENSPILTQEEPVSS